MALGLYTALPGFAGWDDGCAGLLAPALPVVGLILGALWAALTALARAVLPEPLAACILVLSLPAMTGFLHLDGYMDVADALLSSRSREEKLRILKDSHVGSFAVLALACLLMLEAAAALSLGETPLWPLVFLPVVSRSTASVALMSLPPLSQSAYGRLNYDGATGGRRAFCLACGGAAVLAALITGCQGGVACLLAGAGGALACFAAVRSLGGMNGDVAGCMICCAEGCGLVALACL